MTFLCMTAHRNKAVTKQDTGTQQQNDQTRSWTRQAIVEHMCLQRATENGVF